MKIKTSLFLLSSMFVILMAILWFVVFYTFNSLSQDVQEGAVIGQVNKDVAEINILTTEYILHAQERTRQQWRLKYDSLGKLLNGAAKMCRHPGMSTLYDSIKEEHRALGAIFSQLEEDFTKIKKLKEQNRPQEERDLAVVLGERLTAQILMSMQEINQTSFKLSSLIIQEINQTQGESNLIILFSIIVFAGLAALSVSLSIKGITGQINELVKGTQIIARGDLGYRIGLKTKNELGQLGASFNQMTQDLKNSQAKIEEYSKELEMKVAERTKDLEKAYLSLKKRSEELLGAKAGLEEKSKLLEAAKAGLEERVKERTKELEEKVGELERFNKLVVDRELKMAELKERIKELEGKS